MRRPATSTHCLSSAASEGFKGQFGSVRGDVLTVKYGSNGEVKTDTVDAALACAYYHGDVGNKTEVQPKTGQSLKMGTCLDCHKVNNVPTDCTICHK